MSLVQSKSLLAKLMATENLHIEQTNVSTASYDVENRILTVPILDETITSDQYDLFMGHEVGHALYTPLEGLKRAYDLKMSMSVMNVLEDSRIERKIKLKYPGIRQCFIRAYKELIENDFFGTAGQDINKLNFIDRVNLYCKAGIDTGIVFSEHEKTILDEIESTITYEDVMKVYEKVADYMKSRDEKAQDSEKTLKYEDRDEYDGDSEEDTKQSDKEFDSDKKTKTSSTKESDGEQESTSENQSNNDKSVKPDNEPKDTTETGDSVGRGLKSADSNKALKAPFSQTDEAWNKNQDRLFSKKEKSYVYGDIPDYNLDDIIVGYKELWSRYKKDVRDRAMYYDIKDPNVGTNPKELIKFRESSKNIVSYLAKEFELKKNADEMKRTSIAKTGDLNMSKVFSYKFNEDIFKRMSVVPNGKSHGLVMFIDWSGSMSTNMNNTIHQLLNLVMFCKKVSVPFEVYAFTQSYDDIDEAKNKRRLDVLNKPGCVVLCQNFTLMNILSSQMSAVEYKYAASALLAFTDRYTIKPDWFGLSGTPLNEAVVAAMKIVPKFQKERKLQIVNTVFLTDGEGNRPYSVMDKSGHLIKLTYNNILVVRDPVTKIEVSIGGGTTHRRTEREITAGFIKLLKARTHCNIVGFYIMEGRNFGGSINNFWPELRRNEDYDKIEKLKKEFRSDKYKIINSEGYDEYYLLRAEGLDTDDDEEFEVKENATTRGFISAFSKFNNNRKSNRVVLNRFIGMIT